MAEAINWQNRIIEFGTKPADQFQANQANWRKHPTAQQKIMRQALGKVGWVGVVLENSRTGNLIDGHERIWEALENGNADVPYILVDLSPEEETFVLATFDTIGHMAVTDGDQLAALLKDVREGDETLAELAGVVAEEFAIELDTVEPPGDPGAAIDRAAERVSSGDIWRLGRHTIACVDSTDTSAVNALLEEGAPECIWADPPYGIDVAKDGKVGGENLAPVGTYEPVIGDHTTETATRAFSLFYSLAPRAVHVWWGANYYADSLPPSSCWIAWDKRGDIPSNNFADCELAWCSDSGPARIYKQVWMGMIREGSHDKRVHPTQKPIELARWFFAKYGNAGDLIVDPFMGSGISIKAAESLRDDRRVVAFELSPAYCDYVIAWWEAATGLSAVCESAR